MIERRWVVVIVLGPTFVEQSCWRWVDPAWVPYFDASCWAHHTGWADRPLRAGREERVAETDPVGTVAVVAAAAAVVAAAVAAVEYCGIAAVASFVEVAEVVKAAEAAEAFVEAVGAGSKSPLDPEDFADLGVHLVDLGLAHLVAVGWLELVA